MKESSSLLCNVDNKLESFEVFTSISILQLIS